MRHRILMLALVLACAGRRTSHPPTPVASPAATGSPSAVRITFVPQSDSFAAAARDYEQLWATDGARIVRTMESVSGLRFEYPAFSDTAITAIVFEGVSNSGYRRSPMHLRASYPADTKKATLVHELGHRLQAGLFRRDEEEHGPLFLWVYDVWVELYGRDFADEQVRVEKRRGGPYPKAWDDAMALTGVERASRWRAILEERVATRR